MSKTLKVSYTVSGTASLGVDYSRPGKKQRVTIPKGQTQTLIPIVPVVDQLTEQDETVSLTITSTKSYTVDPLHSADTVTIIDANGAPVSLRGRTLYATIASGSYPFASTGTYTVYFSSTADEYVLIGNGWSVADSYGIYTYQKTGPTTGSMTLYDSLLGLGYISWTFAASPVFAYLFTEPSFGGYQTGTMIMS